MNTHALAFIGSRALTGRTEIPQRIHYDPSTGSYITRHTYP